MEEYFTLHDFPFVFLFEPWVVNSGITLAFTSISVGVLALLFEGIRVLRVWLKRRFHVVPLFPILSQALANDVDAVIPANQPYIRASRIRNHVSQTALHLLRVALGYILMLAFMTYNVFVGIGILLGATTGYFLFCHELTRWHEPELCPDAQEPSTKSSSANSSPPGEEAHPMLETSSAGTLSSKNDRAKLGKV